MEITAKYNFARVQARKARIVARTVLNLPAKAALTHLYLRRKRAAQKIFKVLESALANAENNYKLNPENLKVKSIVVDSGPSYRRRRPRSKGRAVPILKRTSHINVVLAEIVPTEKKAALKEKVEIKEEVKPKVIVRGRKEKKELV